MSYLLLKAYSDVINEKTEFLNLTITKSTLGTYHTRLNTLKSFLEYIGNPEITVREVSHEFIKAFELYLRKERGSNDNYYLKNLQRLKQVLQFAVDRKHLRENPLRQYRITFAKKKPVTLTKKEIRMIKGHRFASQRLQQVADLFRLQCYTGLSYADLMLFDKDVHLDRGAIIMDRQKTEKTATIPLIKKAKKLFKKYNWKPPRISNQNYNDYLKEVQNIVGIKKKLTTHVGRKTFGQIYLDKGGSLEVASAMLGHANTRITQESYTTISEERIRREMKAVKKRL